ncbi:TPA: AAA family ATPase, partial [Serratia fonticola]
KMKYEKTGDLDGEKTILFSKNGKLIPVDNLSTGEKQVVFRGIFLLRNTNILDGAAIMIDEPELSMHPKWERKILSYYKSLFSMGGQQRAQIIFATHSDHVLKDALIDKSDSIVVILEDNNGVISCRNIDAPSVLPSITTAETTYLAFDVVSNDYHIELYGWLQDKENVGAVKACDNFIKTHSSYDPLIHARSSHFGATTYDTLSTYIRNSIHHPDSGNTFTESELRASIQLLIDICK